MARRATQFLATKAELILADVVLAECVYVLQSVYEVDRSVTAELMRAALAMPTISADTELLLRALEIYEVDRLDFAEAYLVAAAELTDVESIASFDKAIDRVSSVERLIP
jgi:predicted nucleic-acid-binding protein